MLSEIRIEVVSQTRPDSDGNARGLGRQVVPGLPAHLVKILPVIQIGPEHFEDLALTRTSAGTGDVTECGLDEQRAVNCGLGEASKKPSEQISRILTQFGWLGLLPRRPQPALLKKDAEVKRPSASGSRFRCDSSCNGATLFLRKPPPAPLPAMVILEPEIDGLHRLRRGERFNSNRPLEELAPVKRSIGLVQLCWAFLVAVALSPA